MFLFTIKAKHLQSL